jgi:hypothetical protein
MPRVFHFAKCICCMRFLSDVAEKVKSSSMRDAEKAKARDRADVTAARKRKRDAEAEAEVFNKKK